MSPADFLEPRPTGWYDWDVKATWATFENDEFHQNYRGLELQKCWQDLDRYERIIEATRPDIVIETGTRYGASALWFHRLQRLEVITIDVLPQVKPDFNGPGLLSLRGSSISESVMRQVLPMVQGKRVMVSLDSDHHSPHVQAEIAVWGPLVTPGCYLVVEDACFDFFAHEGWTDRANRGGSQISKVGGPLDAIERQLVGPLAQMRPFFELDTEIDRLYPISHSPRGWWRRREADERGVLEAHYGG